MSLNINTITVIVICCLLAGCVSRPQMQDVSQVCDSSYRFEQDPDKYMEGYRRYAACSDRTHAENTRSEKAWDNSIMGLDAMRNSQPSVTMPDPSAYTLQTQAPSAPQPNPVPNLSVTTQQPTQTWGDTPYAPMIAPVMRDQPVENTNPMIPPAAR